MVGVALLFIVLGLIVLAFGNRLALLGAGVGALLGIAILSILPGTPATSWWLIVPVGLAILFALGAGLARGIISLITLALGALAGGAIVLATLNLLSIDMGWINWILALLGAVIGAALVSRFKEWAVIILAALVGALLTVRGLQMLVPAVQGTVASLLGLLLAAVGILYHGGFLGKRKSSQKK